jgi:CheY-like chemotaxis protein
MNEPNVSRNPRVLVVEDNAFNRQVMLSLLQALGAQADAVADGLEALELTLTERFDMAFLDFNMPELLGTRRAAPARLNWKPSRAA